MNSTETGPAFLVKLLACICALVFFLWSDLIVAFFVIGWLLSPSKAERAQQPPVPIDRIVAVSWGGKKFPAHHGANVYLVRLEDENEKLTGYAVRARIQCGRGNPVWHECGELGRVKTDEEAVARWGTITWTDEGLSIGDPCAGGYFLARDKLESHR